VKPAEFSSLTRIDHTVGHPAQSRREYRLRSQAGSSQPVHPQLAASGRTRRRPPARATASAGTSPDLSLQHLKSESSRTLPAGQWPSEMARMSNDAGEEASVRGLGASGELPVKIAALLGTYRRRPNELPWRRRIRPP